MLIVPAAAACILALRFNVLDTVRLGSIGLAATALVGYCAFWSWFLSWRLVRPLGCLLELASLLIIVLTWRRLSREQRSALNTLSVPTALVFTSAVLILTATYAYGGLDYPFSTADVRFSHQLPGDNELPYTLSFSMMKFHKVPKPIQLDWRASDRPPLQSAVVLGQYFGLLWPIHIAYQVLASLLQSLWIFGLWLLLISLKINRQAIAVILAGCLFSSFVFVNTAFVWPKLMAASYLLGFLALYIGGYLGKQSRHWMLTAILAGFLLAWSLLSHGGSAFACLGLLPMTLVLRKSLSVKALTLTFVTTVVLYLPWILFQKFVDPPGDRLIKMHVAGVSPIDNRPALQTIVESYRAMPIGLIIDYKKQNLNRIFDTFQFWPVLRQFLFELPKGEPSRSAARLLSAKSLNAVQFFYFLSTPGFFILGLPFLLLGVLPSWRSPEWKAAMLFVALTILTNVLWSFVMFGPATTTVHSGTYVTVLISFAAGILGLWLVSRWLAIAVTAAQIALFAYIHVFLLVPYKQPLQYGMVSLLVLAIVCTLYLLWVISKQAPQASHKMHPANTPALDTAAPV